MQLRTRIEHSPAKSPAFTGGEQQGPNPKKNPKKRAKICSERESLGYYSSGFYVRERPNIGENKIYRQQRN